MFEAADSKLLEEFGITDTSNPYQSVSTQHIDGIKYYIKTHTTDYPVRIWNHLYGKNTGMLLRHEDAFYEDPLSYFPELGHPISKDEQHNCILACEAAQFALYKLGYYHTDLYNWNESGFPTHYNCSNVREYMDDYFAIDTEKIIKLPNGGNKKRKTNKKSKKAKKTHNKKAKKAKKSHNKKSKKVKKSKK
jgi:hypothetical protein